MYLQVPFLKKLRVLIVTRFSRDEQRKTSSSAQLELCTDFLDYQGVEFTFLHISDEGVSGELRVRPGILRLRAEIASGNWDLIICEDSSRLYRGVALCMELVGFAVDHRVRVICINDHVDTANDDWEQRLQEAQRHHGQDNFYTRHRIARAHGSAYKCGAAVGPLRTGYLRRKENPNDPKSLNFDDIDPEWTAVIILAFQMVADGIPLDIVANRLNEAGLPKPKNSKDPRWVKRNVISLIRCEVYRGFEYFRKTISKKHHGSGKSKQIRNPDPKKILTREMPHLRIVDDALWYRANEAIDSRTRHKGKRKQGHDHPLYGIPRDSRNPLSNLFVCGICGQKMHKDGRNEGSYRCRGAKDRTCWNKATALYELTHQKIAAAVSQAILKSAAKITPELLKMAERLIQSQGDLGGEEASLRKGRNSLEKEQERILKFIRTSDTPPQILMDELQSIQKKLEEWEVKSRILEAKRQRIVEMPTKEQLEALIQSAAQEASILTRETSAILQLLLDGPIRAVPYLQYGTDKVVLRAEFELNLLELLPSDLRGIVDEQGSEATDRNVTRVSIQVDLFEASAAPKYALEAFRYYSENGFPTLEQIGDHLGIAKRQAHLALLMGKQLFVENLEDPFIRLTQMPDNPSRWRFPKAG